MGFNYNILSIITRFIHTEYDYELQLLSRRLIAQSMSHGLYFNIFLYKKNTFKVILSNYNNLYL
jgi:hypothetical protein